MTVDEVLAASGGQAKSNTDHGRNTDTMISALFASYTAAGINFRADFKFESDRLALVVLTPSTDDCGRLALSLAKAYGSSENSKGKYFSTKRWWDRENGNLVIYLDFLVDGSCSVQYMPLTEGGAPNGL